MVFPCFNQALFFEKILNMSSCSLQVYSMLSMLGNFSADDVQFVFLFFLGNIS